MPLTPTPDVVSTTVHLNPRVQLHLEGGVRALVVAGIPVLHYSASDAAASALARVMLVQEELAGASEVAKAFSLSRMSVYRELERYDERGLDGLGKHKAGPKGPSKLKDAAARQMLALKRRGMPNRQIAVRLGVSEGGVRDALKRMGFRPATEPQQQSLLPQAPVTLSPQCESRPAPSVVVVRAEPPSKPEPAQPSTEAVAEEQDAIEPQTSIARGEPVGAGQAGVMVGVDPWDRTLDRVCARMGLLSEAPPQFGTCETVAGLGVLLALPALMATGIFDIAAKVYGDFGAAFYGVRSVFACLSLMALMRVKRAEHLRHHSPPMMGRVLGLDRAPEVKTLRRKVALLAQQGKSEAFQRALARRRIEANPEAVGFLYCDGHVRPYSGEIDIPKAHVTRMRLSMPATVDHWVNSRDGEPLLVITATPTASMAKEMLAIAREVKTLLGERSATIVFDRGGWSPKLFAELITMGFDILTYRKGRIPKMRKKSFKKREGVFDGHAVTYTLAERKLTLKFRGGGKLLLREVVRLSEDGEHQTSIVTSRKELSDVDVAYRMFARWRQENFFKYMDDEFAIDTLWTYGSEEADANRDVPNPERKDKEQALREAKEKVAGLERILGAAASQNEESKRPTMRGFKIANAAVRQELCEACARVERLREGLREVPRRVTASEAADGEPVLRLKTEAKRLTDTIKSVAYQAETALFRLIRSHYSRHEEEGRKLIASAMQLSGDIKVEAGELHITLAPTASPNRTRAIARLCDELNASETTYPGTQLRLRYAIREA
jgi:prepilin-type processing-associated H-X9-DG protein